MDRYASSYGKEERTPRGRREAGRAEQKKQESRTAGNIDRKLIDAERRIA